ncbi:MAG: hypothetical protein WDN08_02840 [Rhizomicrobium sp.]
MTEIHDKAAIGRAAEPVAAPLAPWRRPTMRVLPARQAELGVTLTGPDGSFTDS